MLDSCYLISTGLFWWTTTSISGVQLSIVLLYVLAFFLAMPFVVLLYVLPLFLIFSSLPLCLDTPICSVQLPSI